MSDLADCCAIEFERYVDTLVNQQRGEKIFLTSPLFTGPFPTNEIPKLKRLVRRALQAREWFKREGPSWSPLLPLSELERFALSNSDDRPLHLLEMYAGSLQARDFDYLGHPLFFDYARGVMADLRTDPYLRENPALCVQYPGKPITGLDEYGRWRPLPDRASRLIERFLAPPR